MDHRKVFDNRKLAIRYWNAEARVVDSELARLEKTLMALGELAIQPVKSLDDPEVGACDLFVVAAQAIPPADFPAWMAKLAARIKQAGHVWTPAVVMARVDFGALVDILPQAVQENWYFDIVNPDHLDSLPVRVANLLRIHDHLRELNRYEATLARLEGKVQELQGKMATLENE